MYAKNQQKNPFPGVDIFNKLADYLTPFEINTLGTTLFVCVCVCVCACCDEKKVCVYPLEPRLALKDIGRENEVMKWSCGPLSYMPVECRRFLGHSVAPGCTHDWKEWALRRKICGTLMMDSSIKNMHPLIAAISIYIYISKRIQKEQNYT